jgi:TRAP-type uncharacterized transport system substrate-binding protein
MDTPKKIIGRSIVWSNKGLVRVSLLIGAAAIIAGVASAYGIARDFGYLRASLLSGVPGGQYHALATRLAARADREHGVLVVVPTAGSVENVTRLAGTCTEAFALAQDGTPVPADARLEVLGRLPEPESLILLGRQNRSLSTFEDLRGASIGIGPEGSGTAYLMRQLFEDADLRALGVRLSLHDLGEQAELVGKGELDLAAFVVQEDAEFLRTVIHRYGLDVVSPRDVEGLVARHPWLGLGRIPAGRYGLVPPKPALDKFVARIDTLVLTNSCAHRAERIAFLMLLSSELPGFVRSNPPRFTNSATALPLAPEARKFYLTGEPDFADRYFPWLVNLMSPAYWVYLVMAVTVLFNAMTAGSRFRLWRIDAAREKLEARLTRLTGPGLTREQIRALPPEHLLTSSNARLDAKAILDQLADRRVRCQRQTGSIITPMGDEMFYRYQESLIDEAMTTLAMLLQRTPRQNSAAAS